ncbi:MAG: 16S rRNA (guanine(527)-N(7))-methyltransferase RsmG [Streptosporangiaceae bacterium]
MLSQAAAYAALLAGPGIERGLIGPAEAERIWERHLINSGLVVELLPAALGPGEGGARKGADAPSSSGQEGGSVLDRFTAVSSDAREPVSRGSSSDSLADLGSGAGLPGMVLAILRPDLRVTLIEPMARRTSFLAECVSELGLVNVQICRGRAEELAGDVQADVVTSRAVARLDRLAELCAGICRPGGLVLAIKGASAEAELEGAQPVLRRLGMTDAEVVMAGRDLAARGLVEHATTVVRLSMGLGAKGMRRRSRDERWRTRT